MLENTTATAVLLAGGRCVGVAAQTQSARLALTARGTVLATGGAAALWARTTNPPGATGTGMILAHAAGADLADLELVQFHPTALVTGGAADGFLITEAVRGEGATLVDGAGERFVDELAARDEVALAIERKLREGSCDSVSLDMRTVDPRRFPNIAQALANVGIDPARDLIPVAPAAHYTIGGVATDLDGVSSLPGLLAIGECACTGVHGANRLASNSLAECLVFGRRAALAAASGPDPAAPRTADTAPLPPRPGPSTRAALWRLAGLRRTPEGLRELAGDPFAPARLIAGACLARAESRGAHQRSDLPATDPALDGHHTVVRAGGATTVERWA